MQLAKVNKKSINVLLTACGTVAVGFVLLLAGCFGFLQWTTWHDCWFPPNAPQLEIVVSACEQPQLISFSPEGRYMLYSRIVSGRRERFVYDLGEGTMRQDSDCGDVWLDETLRLQVTQDPIRWHYRVFQVCDTQTGIRTRLVWVPEIGNIVTETGAVVFQPTGAMHQGPDKNWIYSPTIIKAFQNARHVYFIQGADWAIALDDNPQSTSANTFVLSMPDLSGNREDVLEFLQTNQISYVEINFTGTTAKSHNGNYSFHVTNICPGWLGSPGNSCMVISLGKENPFVQDTSNVSSVSSYQYRNDAAPRRFAWVFDDSGVIFQFSTGDNCFLFCLAYPAKAIYKLDVPTSSPNPSPTFPP